jgi:phosphoglycerol transferase MdoB-like AlkP superfamily enzyme
MFLTSSNHPPLTVQFNKNDIKEIADKLPENLKSKELALKLLHFKYADKQIADFMENTRKLYPDSLFIITGDHSQRWHIKSDADLYQKTAVPFILYGKGISKNTFNANASASHIDIMPTLIELIAPKGFKYRSLGAAAALNNIAIGQTSWLYNNAFGLIDGKVFYLNDALPPLNESEIKTINEKAKAAQTAAYWRVMNGDNLL